MNIFSVYCLSLNLSYTKTLNAKIEFATIVFTFLSQFSLDLGFRSQKSSMKLNSLDNFIFMLKSDYIEILPQFELSNSVE